MIPDHAQTLYSSETNRALPMTVSDLKFPDFSDHPPPPQLTYEQYQRWVCEDIIPELTERGEMTEEKLIADFMNNEGRVTSWPDFGVVREKSP